ncbi:MAG: hypothetical protein FJ271_00140 [Planctomycetes bacterium]|nr:hypothetical protein [Planctomycetota bacterium]
MPIRRVKVPASRLAAELERARAGILVPLSRDEFEKRVRLAGKVRQEQPRLLRASYRATVDDNALINGRGEWTVQHQGRTPAILPLPDFNLALSQLRDANNKDAVLAEFDGKSLGLVIAKIGDKIGSDQAGGEKPANQKFYFDWTLRASPSALGQTFVMQIPPCAAATLELRLGADQLLVVSPKSAMLSGPHESESPKHRIWRLNFTGRSQIEFAVKKQSGPEGRPAVLTSLQCRQQLQPGRCQSEFEYQFECAHGFLEQFAFICDPDLEPYEVTVKNVELKGWVIREESKGKKLLLVSLREPIQGTLSGLVVRCFSPLKADQRWISPGLHVQQAFTRGEVIQLTLPPEVQLQGWKSGQFQLLRSSVNPGGAKTLILARSGAGPKEQAEPSTRPTGTPRFGSVEFLAKQQSWWNIGPRGATLTTEIAYEIHRGNLFQLELKLPEPVTDWTVEAVQLNPGKKTPTWMLAGSNLLIKLDAPLTSTEDVRLRVRLRSEAPRNWPAGGLVMPFADLAPAEPCLHAGELGVSIDPTLDVRVLGTELASGPVDVHGPWGKNALDYVFSYRQQAVAGKLQVKPRRARLDAQVFTEATLSGPLAAWRTKLTLTPRAGIPSSIELAISGTELRRLRLESLTTAVRALSRQPIAEALPVLLALGCRSEVEQALLGLALPRGQRWRIELVEPLEQRTEINLEATLQPLPSLGGDAAHKENRNRDQQAWHVPLVTVLDAERQETQVAVQTMTTEVQQSYYSGLSSDAAPPGGAQSRLTLQGTSPFPSLAVITRLNAGSPQGAAETCEHALLLTEWQPDGTLVHHFRFELLNWSKPSMPVVLPAGARQVLGVRADGRWLDTFPRELVPDGLRVDLPVPADGFRHVFELVYLGPPAQAEWPIGDWFLGGVLPAPLPKLPVAVLASQRRWLLPPDMVPLRGTAFRKVGDPHSGLHTPPGTAQLRRLWHTGDSLFTAMGFNPGAAAIEGQRERLAAAEIALRKRTTKPRHLGDLLQDLALELGRNDVLVLDAYSLSAAGLHVQSPVNAARSDARGPLWRQAGLIIVPCQATLLVTTRAWLDSQTNRDFPERADDELARPVQEALLNGQDGSGRFRTLASWLRVPARAGDATAGLEGSAHVPGRLPGWTEWEIVPGQPEVEDLTVIRRQFITVCGIVLALAMLLIARSISKHVTGAWRFRLLLTWMCAALLGCIWLPSPFAVLPVALLFSAFLLGVVHGLSGLWGVRDRPLAGIRRSLTILLAGGCSLATMAPARSGGDEPFTVFLLPGKNADAPNTEQRVLVPQELLTQLERLANGASPLDDTVVLTGARYQGTVSGASADLTVDFSCFSFVDKSQLFVPLDGVDLRPEAFLDGAPVYPVVAPAPRSGYLIPVQGRGPHKLALSFTTRVSQSGANQQVRFQIPRLAQSQLAELKLPASIQDAQAIGALGSQALARSGSDWVLKAQIGPQQLLDVRWRSATEKPTPAAQIEVRELYYWDLRLPLPSLTGILRYSIGKGQISSLSVALPEELEVRSVEALPGPTSESIPRLKSWSVRADKNRRILAVELFTPFTGEMQLKLGMAPRLAVRPGNVALPLPLPLQVKPAGFQEGFLAYRIAGLEAREIPKDLGIIGIEPAAFIKVWRQVDDRDEVRPTRAVNFRRNAPSASLRLNLLAPGASAAQEITWDVQPFHADVTAICEIHAPAGDLMLIEWHVPAAVVLADIHGPHVHSWSRQNAIVQVWLTQPQKETRVTLWGWMRLAAPLLPGKAGTMALPHVSLRQPMPTSTAVRLQPEKGLKLEPARLDGLRRLPPGESSNALHLTPTGLPGSNYSASVRLTHAPLAPTYRSLTVMQAHGDRLTLAADLAVQGSPDGTPLHAQARGWPDHVQLDLSDFVASPRRHKNVAGVSWTVLLPPGLSQRIPLRLRAETSLTNTGDMLMPDVRIAGASAQDRWVGVLGSELVGVAATDAKPTAERASILALWPDIAKQLHAGGTLWKLLSNDWRLAVKVRPSFAEPSVQVVAAELDSALAPDGRWLHEARFDLYARAEGSLRLLLPGNSSLLALYLDAQPVVAAREGKYLRLPLPGTANAHVLRVRWQHAASDESIEAPNLTMPTIAGLRQVQVVGTVWLPAGFREGSLSRGQPLSTAQWMLERARAQLRIITLLAQQRKDTDVEAWEQSMRRLQARLYWCCRQAEHQSNLARSEEPGAGNDAGIVEASRQLQLENARLAENQQFMKLQKTAAKISNLRDPDSIDYVSSLTRIGMTRYWKGEPGVTPLMHLAAEASRQYRRQLLVSQATVMALVGLLILSCLPVAAWLGRVLWPEQLLLLAAAGCIAFGFSLPGAVLIMLGLLARVMLLTRLGQRWQSRRADSAPGGSSMHAAG